MLFSPDVFDGYPGSIIHYEPHSVKRRAWRAARKAALQSKGNFRLGATLYSGNKVIKTGHNLQGGGKSHPIVARWTDREGYKSLHAELHALMGVHPARVRGCDVYVFRIRRDGSQGCAKPCQNCQSELARRGINRIYYTLDDMGHEVIKL
jgi:deoxycytidylate deaminase